MKSTNLALALSIVSLGLGAKDAPGQTLPAGGAPPKVERLPALSYIAVRRSVSMDQLSGAIRDGIGQVAGWLGAHGAQPAGAPLVRYLVVDMPGRLDIEIGFPVGGSIKAEAPVVAGVLPSGRYVTYTHTGSYDGLASANGAVLRWAKTKNVVLDHKPARHGDAWKARAEIYLTDPSKEHDPSNFKTRIIFGLAK